MPHPRMIGKPSFVTKEEGFKLGIDATTRISEFTFFPPNEYNIVGGFYSHSDIVKLLRAECCNPQAVLFIADMME